MNTGIGLAVAAVFVWLGMVLAISFVEAPLKFRVPGVTLGIGLGIGQLVVRVLNVFEYLFAIIVGAALFTHDTSASLNVAGCVAVGALLAQTILVRPLLSRRTAEVLDGSDEGRGSEARYVYIAYIALEFVKVVALVWTGVLLIGDVR